MCEQVRVDCTLRGSAQTEKSIFCIRAAVVIWMFPGPDVISVHARFTPAVRDDKLEVIIGKSIQHACLTGSQHDFHWLPYYCFFSLGCNLMVHSFRVLLGENLQMEFFSVVPIIKE